MSTKKEIYWYLANNCEIYLPTYQIDKVTEEIKNLIDVFDVFDFLDSITNNEEYKKYNDPAKGAYQDGEEHKIVMSSIKKKITAINEEGEMLEFESIYDAGKHFGKKATGCGNIHRAIRTGGKAYGYKWSNK